jgi:glycosyltransferase involved in cell wall biosynthesis
MSDPIFYITRILPAYRIPVLKALNEQLEGRLVVGHGRPPERSSLSSLTEQLPAGFDHLELTNYWLRRETIHAQRYKPLFDRYGAPSTVLAEESPRSISLPFLLRYAKKQGAARVLWGHFTSNHRRFSPWHPLDRYRLEMARAADACICYSEPIKRTLSNHINPDHLFVARNTVDVDRLLDIRASLNERGRPAVREELDLPADTPVLLFLGRLIKRKKAAQLLEVFQSLRGKRSAQLVIIGDGPERANLEEYVEIEQIPDVTFTGAITDREVLGRYLFAADVMVIPGYLGLAVNDAFAFGLPVVSREAPSGQRFHSPEIAYLEPGVNGELAAPDDPRAMVEAVERILDAPDEYSENALTCARNHLTIDRMVDGLVRAIEYAEDNR